MLLLFLLLLSVLLSSSSCHCYYRYYHYNFGIFNHQCMWTCYYKITWDFAMMWQIAAFKYIFNWYLHLGIYSSMEYSITWRHKLCRAFTLDALASRPVACVISYACVRYLIWALIFSVAFIFKDNSGIAWCNATKGKTLVVAVGSRMPVRLILYWWNIENVVCLISSMIPSSVGLCTLLCV